MPPVLYKKSKKTKEQQMDHDDIWNDSLLIKAYEESVKLRNEDVAKKLAMKTNKKETLPDTKTSSSSEDESSIEERLRKFKVGDYVRSTFSEDGVDYEAEITTINDNGTCSIRYIGYGNEEKVKLENLVESWGEDARDVQIQLAEADSQAANAQNDPDTTQIPQIPVPPMPPMPPAFNNSEDSEYLSSMLISWYMSGYYTGLYYGRKQQSENEVRSTTLKKSGGEMKSGTTSKIKKTKKM